MGGSIWRRDALCLSIVVHAAGKQPSVDASSLLPGQIGSLQHHDSDSLARDHAVSASIECMTNPSRREHPRATHGLDRHSMGKDIGRSDDSHIALTVDNTEARLV